MSSAEIARIDEIEERRRAGEVTEAELVERFRIVWPCFFAELSVSPPPVDRVGVQASIEVNRSLSEHFERGTLMRALPELRLPVLFVHGEQDPVPVSAAKETAALIPGSRVETIPDCGHFPWHEQPEAFRRAVERLLSGFAGSERKTDEFRGVGSSKAP